MVDFKSKLRSTASNNSNSNNKSSTTETEQNNFKAHLKKVDTSKRDSLENADEKRKSTGSISSLRKMWETGDPSPKLGGRKNEEEDEDKKSPVTEHQTNNQNNQTVKFEKRVWPPVPNSENTEKPMVPVKPTMKPPPPTTKPPKEPMVKPPPKPPTKPIANNIYAAPNSKPTPPPKKPVNTAAVKISKEFLLSYFHDNLEDNLNTVAQKQNKSSTSTLMKLSDNVGSFHNSCSGFIDNVPATGRFRFRSLLMKLEQQSQELRNNQEIAGDIRGTCKDIISVISR